MYFIAGDDSIFVAYSPLLYHLLGRVALFLG